MNTFTSKPRYEILDGLRGVAALMVIIFHCFESYIPVFGTQHINHGYLAVDFFFVLSGFVIGYAYDDRWGGNGTCGEAGRPATSNGMSVWQFFKRRLIRLHPMVVAGTVIGACLFFFQDTAFPQIRECQGWMFALCFVMGLLMIPCGTGLDIRGWGEFNSLNGPNWSLTFEYFGNILYAFILHRLPTVVLAALAAGSAFFTLDMTMGWDVFGLFAEPKYDVIGGWSLTADQMYIGVSRLLYPFLCGLVISRILRRYYTDSNHSGSPLHAKGGFWWCSIMLAAIFCIPQIGGKSCVADGAFQAVSIVVLFPLIVLLGAGSVTTDSRSTRVCKFLGELSYPLYITHYPLMYIQMGYVQTHADAPVWQHIVLNAGVVVFSVVLAWCVYKAYDLPVRHWLTARNRANRTGTE